MMVHRVRHSLAFLLLPVGVLLATGGALAAPVVIIRNANQAPYLEPSSIVEIRLKAKNDVSVFDIGAADLAAAKGIALKAQAKKPVLVVALGDKAAYVAKQFLPNTPLVFGLVGNWEAMRFDRVFVTGVGDALEPETMCSQINTFFPTRKRIGIVYTNLSKAYVERASRKAALLKMSVVSAFVNSGDGFIDAYRNLSKNVDLFWLLMDPTLITRENLQTLTKEAAEKKLPTVGYSPNLVKAGLFMSVTVNNAGVGRQLASMAEQILAGKKPEQLPIASPEAASVSMNRQLVTQFGLKFDPMLLDFVDLITPQNVQKK